MHMQNLNWVQVILAVWLIISPWVLDFNALISATRNNVIIGVLIGIVALWALFGGKSSTPTS